MHTNWLGMAQNIVLGWWKECTIVSINNLYIGCSSKVQIGSVVYPSFPLMCTMGSSSAGKQLGHDKVKNEVTHPPSLYIFMECTQITLTSPLM